jgi:hypothetical protein
LFQEGRSTYQSRNVQTKAGCSFSLLQRCTLKTCRYLSLQRSLRMLTIVHTCICTLDLRFCRENGHVTLEHGIAVLQTLPQLRAWSQVDVPRRLSLDLEMYLILKTKLHVWRPQYCLRASNTICELFEDLSINAGGVLLITDCYQTSLS